MTNQSPRTAWSQKTGHILLHPHDILGNGAEGSVYKLRNHPNLVAKIYHPNKLTSDTIKKLEVMINYPPRIRDEQTGHLFVSWPIDTVHDTPHGNLTGFLMPLVNKTNQLYQCYNPSSRRKYAPHINYVHLCSIAKSLATALDRIHGITYASIIGDINESNIYVTENEKVTIIDADSFQITDSRTTPPTIYRCGVGKPEYTPPELQAKTFSQIDRNVHHDNFALAVVIYQLLMEGTHPFRGIYTGPGEKPQVETHISHGHFLHTETTTQQLPLKPPPAALPWESLPSNLREMFLRCFDDGHSDPTARPSPRDWERALDDAMQDLVKCALIPSHWYFGRISSPHEYRLCTWCERKTMLGIDSFPHQPASLQPAPPHIPAEHQPFRRPPPQKFSVPPSETTRHAQPEPPRPTQYILVRKAPNRRRPLWKSALAIAAFICIGNSQHNRHLWLRLFGLIAALWAVTALINMMPDHLNPLRDFSSPITIPEIINYLRQLP